MGSEGEQPKQLRSKKAWVPWFIISIFIPAYFSNFHNLLNSPGQLGKHKFQSRTMLHVILSVQLVEICCESRNQTNFSCNFENIKNELYLAYIYSPFSFNLFKKFTL